jgi:hypothetical protein
MKINKLNKSGVLKRYMRIDPETDAGKYILARDSSHIKVKAVGLEKDDLGARIKLAVSPSPRGGRMILVEPKISLGLLGQVIAPTFVREDETVELYIKSKAKELEAIVLDLDYVVKLTLVTPELV